MGKGNNSQGRPEGRTPPPELNFPLVGIGASAGGLAAFEKFFSGIPADSAPGLPFVLAPHQHLPPADEGILVEPSQGFISMQVFEVEDGVASKANRVSIIPPNRDPAFLTGTPHLLQPPIPHGHRLPINFFFHSLAQDQHERAICIAPSGLGSDGTLGIRDVKTEGGMVMAQQSLGRKMRQPAQISLVRENDIQSMEPV